MLTRDSSDDSDDSSWASFNALCLGLEGGVGPLRRAVDLLENMEVAATAYAAATPGWSTNVGLYFHVYGHAASTRLALHVVDLDAAGPTHAHLAPVNLPLRAALEVLASELDEAVEGNQREDELSQLQQQQLPHRYLVLGPPHGGPPHGGPPHGGGGFVDDGSGRMSIASAAEGHVASVGHVGEGSHHVAAGHVASSGRSSAESNERSQRPSIDVEVGEAPSFLAPKFTKRASSGLSKSAALAAAAASSGTPPPEATIKIIIVGDSNTGKTCLMKRFVEGRFPHGATSTVSVDVEHARLELGAQNVSLQLHDTAGQERFAALCTPYFRGADGVILAYDLTRPKTFERVGSFWRDEVIDKVGNAVPTLLVGCKGDLVGEGERTLPIEQVEAQAEAWDLMHFEVSAKTGDRVRDAFYLLACTVMNERLEADAMNVLPTHGAPTHVGGAPPPKTGGCGC